MEHALPWISRPSLARCRELAWPKEHGSWSLALEPLAFALIAAPSAAGACLAGAVTAGFFARRPLRIACRDARPDRRKDAFAIVVACAIVALAAFAGALHLGGIAWVPWLLPTLLAGGIFLAFDLRNDGRAQAAEVAGSAAFALLPAAFAMLAGLSAGSAVALALVMGGRAVPTVLTVRAALREAKTGERHRLPAVASVVLAVSIAVGLAARGFAPWTAVAALGVLAVRTLALLVYPRPTLRARTIGMIEAALGVTFVVVTAFAWNA